MNPVKSSVVKLTIPVAASKVDESVVKINAAFPGPAIVENASPTNPPIILETLRGVFMAILLAPETTRKNRTKPHKCQHANGLDLPWKTR